VKILVIHTYGLGDMVMATPALRVLSRHVPKARIDLLVFQKFSAAPVEACGENINVLYGSFDIFKLMGTIMRLRRNRYDYMLHTSGTDTLKMALFMALLKGDVRIAEVQRQWIPWYRYPLRGNHAIHRVEANLRLIAPIVGEELSGPECKPHFCLEPSERKYAEDFLSKNGLVDKRLIGIHPGCNEKFSYKRWEVEKYIDLVGRMYDRLEGAEILLFAGPDERKEADILKERYPALVVVRENLNRVAALISHLSLMITNDSGLGHIASCFEVKTVTIFSGSSRADPHKIAPYTMHSCVVDFRKEKCDDEVSYVMETVDRCWSER